MIKQATTIDEQIKLLKSRGMAVPDEDKAKEILMDIGFYRLGFYAFPFEKSFPSLTNRSHEYKPDSSFTDVVELYYFDYDLRKILTYYLNRIEINLRTYITYTISNHYKKSPTWFVDPSIMYPSYIADFEHKVYKTIRENPVIKRHHSRYKDLYAPAWKTMEFMTLGNICSLFNSLKDNNLKKTDRTTLQVRTGYLPELPRDHTRHPQHLRPRRLHIQHIARKIHKKQSPSANFGRRAP